MAQRILAGAGMFLFTVMLDVLCESGCCQLFNVCDVGICGPGQYLDVIQNMCKPCRYGTFIDLTNHGCRDCKPWSKPVLGNQIIVKEGNSTHDSILGCPPGMFQKGPPVKGSWYCAYCSECSPGEHVTSECGGRLDTQCGKVTSPPPTTNTVTTVLAKAMMQLQPFSVILSVPHLIGAEPVQFAPHVLCDRGPCGPGFYFNKNQSCQKCPAGTYQAVSGHKCTDCALCSEPSEFEEVKEPCTARQDTVRGCKAGYFETGNPIPPECGKCQSCAEDEILVQPCGGRDDTLCVKKTPLLDNGESAAVNKVSNKGVRAWADVNLLVAVFMFII